jgi:hypothetical protein
VRIERSTVKMKKMFDPSQLRQFTGTTQYYRILPTFVVTDGVKYLMDGAECYWLAQLYGLHLVDIDFNREPFTVLKLNRKGEGARIVIEDGNGKTLSYQGLDYTDFPMGEITLFASWSGEFWVAMLPSEY